MIKIQSFLRKWMYIKAKYSLVLLNNTQVRAVLKYLVHAGSGLVEKSPGLNMFWYQLASHNWNLGPPVKDLQSQMLIGFYWLV